jgi:hypothetical protein
MFLLIDYILYRLQLGRYSVERKRNRHPINLSWEGDYEQVLEEVLASGDVIFCAHDNSFISWSVQYFTKTDISHTGVYIGNGKVLHATLSGTRIDHLSTFFGRGCHVIPVRMQDLFENLEVKDEDPDFSDYVGKPYALKSVIFRGLLYMLGIPWRKFRFTYIFDLVLLFSIFSVVVFGEGFLLPFIIVSSAYLLILMFAFLGRNRLKIPISDPGEGFYYLPSKAKVIPSVKKINEKWFLNRISQVISREN